MKMTDDEKMLKRENSILRGKINYLLMEASKDTKDAVQRVHHNQVQGQTEVQTLQKFNENLRKRAQVLIDLGAASNEYFEI